MSDSTALTKRSAETDLMPPPPPPKRIKRPPIVLDEDTYTSAVSHIIARDFFPGLLEVNAQQDYLDALDSNDSEWIQEAERNVRSAMTPVAGRRRSGRLGQPSAGGATPWRGVGGETPRGWSGGETPGSVRPGATPSHPSISAHETAREPEVDLSLSLSAFQAKYTTEDNESFHSLMDKAAIKKREKNPWLWNGNKLPSKQQIAQAAQRQRLLASSSPNTERSLTLASDTDNDKRPPMFAAKPPTKTPHNNLMFLPDDISNTHPTLTPTAETAQAKSAAPPKTVNHAATRFSLPPVPAPPSIPPSPSLSAIDAAIAGHPRHRADSTIAGSDAGGDGSETPRVNGYAFVDAEPTPSEVAAFRNPGAAAAEQQERESRAALLAAMRSDDAGGANPFTIAGESRREALRDRLVERQMSKNKGRVGEVQRAGATPRFASSPRVGLRSGSGGQGGMTPAAQALFQKVGGGATPARELNAFDGRKKGDWTPTPLRVRKAGS